MMAHKYPYVIFACASLLLVLLAACSGIAPAAPTAGPPLGTATFSASPAVTQIAPLLITPIPTLSPVTPAPTPPPTRGATAVPGGVTLTDYLDDRSDPVQVLRSFFNAVNRKEYVRAYSYWQIGAGSGLPPFPQFEKGYADTQSVQMSTGPIQSGVAAGQLYWQVPVSLVAKTTSGATQTFVGCYTVHLARPELQAAPPYHSMGITLARVTSVANNANTTELMKTSCR
jgi:hypothetical protein